MKYLKIIRPITFILSLYFGLWNEADLQAQHQNFLNFKINSQLPFSRIHCLQVDKNNIKWLGTDNGFASFSGDSISTADKWRLYDRPNSTDTLFRQVSALTIDINGHKWLGTYNDYDKNTTLVELDRQGNFVRQYPLPNSANKDMFINELIVDKYERKWLATEEAGVWMLNEKNQWTNYRYEDIEQMRSNSIQAIGIDKGGLIWVGTDRGLCSVNDEGYWEVYDVRDFVSSITTDNNYHVCLSIIDKKDRQLLYCDTDDFIEAERRSKKDRFFFNDIAMDNKGVVWMAGNGLAKHEQGKRIIYDRENSDFYAEEATCLALDNDGNLWIGTIGEGLFKYIVPENQKKEEQKQPDTQEPKIQEVEFVAIQKMEALALEISPLDMTLKNTLKKYIIPKVTYVFEEEPEEKIVFMELSKLEPNLFEVTTNISTKISTKLYKIPVVSSEWLEPELIEEEEVKIGAKVNLPNIQFKPRSYELTSLEGVKALLRFMNEYPKVKIELAGHTDMNPPKGNPKYAELSERFMRLSQQRIDAVASYLFANGISRSRVVMKAYGGTQPLELKSNSKINRRVEMKILEIE